jgi:hypothetical protein
MKFGLLFGQILPTAGFHAALLDMLRCCPGESWLSRLAVSHHQLRSARGHSW